MRKKKIIILATLIMVLLTACNRTDTYDDKENPDNISKVESEDVQDTMKDNIEEVEVETNETIEDIVDDRDVVNIEEQVLLDQDGIKITALELNIFTSFRAEGTSISPEFLLRIENNSDINISIEMEEASINCLMVWPDMLCRVDAGEQIEESISIPYDNMKNSGIDIVSTFEFRFYIMNDDNYEVVNHTDVITINTSAKDYVQKYDDAGEVLYDKDGIKIVFKGLDDFNKFGGPEILFFLENNTDETIAVSMENFLANEDFEYGAFYREVTPGKKAVDTISFLDADGNSIPEIKNIEFLFNIFDYNTGETIEETDMIYLSFE